MSIFTDEELKEFATTPGDKYFFDENTTFIKEQTVNVNDGGKFFNGSQPSQSKEAVVLKKLKKIIAELNAQGKTGGDLILPYAAAYSQSLVPRYDSSEFNATFGTNISDATYSKYMTAFFKEDFSKSLYTTTDLNYYINVFKD